MDRILQLQHNNLRKCMRENLIEPILGKNYYNYGIDCYTTDKFTTEDLKYKFDKLKNSNKALKIGLGVSLAVNICVILYAALR